MFKWTKRLILCGLVVGGVGAITVGTGAYSYVRSAGRLLKDAVQDAVSIEFEIQRARDLLADLVPEMHANLRLVAVEEVEVANLENEIATDGVAIHKQKDKIRGLRAALKTESASYDFGGRAYLRSEVVEELSRSFDNMKTAEMIMSGKRDLLRNRRRSLDAAVKKLEKTRVHRLELASQIEALEAQFRLVQAQSSGCEFQLDDSKLAQTERLISDLKKRLSVAQRVLAREARFVELIPIDAASEKKVKERVDAYLDGRSESAASREASF